MAARQLVTSHPSLQLHALDTKGNAASPPTRTPLARFPKRYADLKGVWKDTLFVKPGYQVITRTRYQRYIGESCCTAISLTTRIKE
jgi:FtsP/CotA-like multicopper oxidase with cupredoxin domain